MISFCTLFDSFYLARALALYDSLARECERDGMEFELLAYCLDQKSEETLRKLALPRLRVIGYSEIESPELNRLRKERTVAEFCWTCTPIVLDHGLRVLKISELTYLDADLFFFSNPLSLVEELRQVQGSVLITEHRYSQDRDQAETSGKYCVQFMTFHQGAESRKVLSWWKDRCIEWCYDRFEEGKFGDQKYLDDWLTRFDRVVVLKNLGGGVAPWNVESYQLAWDGVRPTVDGAPVVFYHFHGVKLYTDGVWDLSEYRLSEDAILRLYEPYALALQKAYSAIRELEPEATWGLLKKTDRTGFRSKVKTVKRKIRGTLQLSKWCVRPLHAR